MYIYFIIIYRVTYNHAIDRNETKKKRYPSERDILKSTTIIGDEANKKNI